MSFRVVIPARLGSTRLPRKALADIAGKPMVVRVAHRALLSGADDVWVATDSQQIVETVRGHGLQAVLTRHDHPSGTDRIAEVVAKFGWADDAVVVNVQGDEPLIDPALVRGVAECLTAGPDVPMATACHPIVRLREFLDPNVVKVVCDAAGHAAYFSRAPIPWPRDAGIDPRISTDAAALLPAGAGALRHIGLYAYRAGFLKTLGTLAPSPLERAESLEQLRVLWHGYHIRVLQADAAPEAGVDTPEDLRRVRQRFEDGTMPG